MTSESPTIPPSPAMRDRSPHRPVALGELCCGSLWIGREPAIEWIIRLCGWSAIFFVFAIFFFVFREAAPVLFGKLNLIEFFTSARWQPILRGAAGVRHLGAAGGHAGGHGLGDGSWPCRWDWARRCSSPSSAAASSRKPSKSSSNCWRPFPRSSGDSSATWCSGR